MTHTTPTMNTALSHLSHLSRTQFRSRYRPAPFLRRSIRYQWHGEQYYRRLARKTLVEKKFYSSLVVWPRCEQHVPVDRTTVFFFILFSLNFSFVCSDILAVFWQELRWTVFFRVLGLAIALHKNTTNKNLCRTGWLGRTVYAQN